MKYPMRLATPFVPLSSSGVGLLEKRETVVSTLLLEDSLGYIGDWNHTSESLLVLDQDADWHNNHGSDPATHSLSLVSSASQIMEKARGIEDTVNLADFVHASLDGYHTPGTGDTYLDRYSVTANEAVSIGQPVYISGNNTVNLADADDLATAHVLGLAETSATANSTVNVLSSGTINQADWTTVIGTQFLTPGEIYYLTGAKGTMSVTPPTGDGDVIVSCGIAITTTKLDIEINEIAVL
jgi:hypothetical protein